MNPPSAVHKWFAKGTSIKGASHIKSGIENQDAYSILASEETKDHIIAAVADGHGDAQCFRSHIGSRLAVESAVSELKKFFLSPLAGESAAVMGRETREQLANRIWMSWRKKISEYHERNDFSEREKSTLREKRNQQAVTEIEDNQFLAYGATLLAVLVAPKFIIYVKIGDGEVVVVPENLPPERPIPVDERLVGNETTSLSGKSAVGDFRVYFQNIYGPAPALIFLCTDGFSNAFIHDPDLYKVGEDLLELAKAEGPPGLKRAVEKMLNETATNYTYDDSTLIVLVREDLVGNTAKPVPADENATAINDTIGDGGKPPSGTAETDGTIDKTAGDVGRAGE